jgi:hypothetical protein
MSETGNAILLRARQHAGASRVTETLKKIEVPEWGTEIYFWPEMSVEEKRGVFRHMKSNGQGGIALAMDALIDAAVAQVCLRARNSQGIRLFSDGDESAIAQTHPDVLTEISNQMGWGSRPTMEDAEKN